MQHEFLGLFLGDLEVDHIPSDQHHLLLEEQFVEAGEYEVGGGFTALALEVFYEGVELAFRGSLTMELPCT